MADRLTEKHLTEQERQQWLNNERLTCANEDVWQQEYCCNPLDETSAFLTYEMILAAEKAPEEILQPLNQLKGDIYVGFDVARKQDLSVIVLAEKAYNALIVRHLITLKNTPFSEQKRLLFDILKLPSIRRCCIDASGLGMNLAEEAQQYFGAYRVEPVTFSAPVKAELATDLRIAFEDHALFIPAQPELRADLHSIKRVTTIAGNIRFDAERSETDGHADRFWALALATHAAKSGEAGTPWVVSGSRRECNSLLMGF